MDDGESKILDAELDENRAKGNADDESGIWTDVASEENDEDDFDDGIFDDVDDSEDGTRGNEDENAATTLNASENEDRTEQRKGNSDTRKRKRKRQEDWWLSDRWLGVRRALERRMKREEELERQRDPEQFDDTEDSVVSLGAYGTRGSQRFSRRRPRIDHSEVKVTPSIANTTNDRSHRDDGPETSGKEIPSSTPSLVENLERNDDDNSSDLEPDATDECLPVSGGSDPKSNGTDRNDPDSNFAIDNDEKQSSSSSSSPSYFKVNERTLFSAPRFPPEIKQEAFDRIYAAIEEPLKLLEERGYEAYREYMEGNDDEMYRDPGRRGGDRNRNQLRRVFRNHNVRNLFRKRERDREESIRKGLRDALVNGDPREYQRTIFEVARKRNTIVNLGTGAGKTLIALLLIRDVWSTSSSRSKANKSDAQTIDTSKASVGDSEGIQPGRETEGGSSGQSKPRKQYTLFVVPSVALAIQQSLTLRANLPNLRIETACYTTASSKRARASLGSCDVIVATHGAIQDLLMHYGDTFSMDRFNLVVIDECHYATGRNHNYRYLMEKFYHPLEPEQRPRVLGLTASPILSVKENHSDEQLKALLDNLEKVLDSKILSAAGLIGTRGNEQIQKDSATTTVPPVAKVTNNLLYRIIDEQSLNYHETNMNRTVPSADNLDLLPSRYREFRQLECLYKDLGPLVLSIYCSVVRRELSPNIFENESTQRFERALDHLRRVEAFCNQEIKVLPNMGRNDKLLALEELIETLIEENGAANTIGLVFVERRITAIALNCYFAWRKKQIADSATGKGVKSWKFAKHARREAAKWDSIFDLKSSRTAVHQSDDGSDNDYRDDQFDDSTDDPFHVFQRHSKTRDRNRPSSAFDPEKIVDDYSDLLHSANRFMDAESDEDYDSNDGTADKSQKYSSHKHGRVAVKSVALVRSPMHIFNTLSLTRKKINESERAELYKNWVHRECNVRDVLNKLRRGDLNMMFATSVVEEGVDVQACSFVVAFDGLKSIKGYIQMKGRARKQDAKFFVFRDPHDNRRSKLELDVAQTMECRIDRIIEQRMGMYAPTVQKMSSHNKDVEGTTMLPKELAAVEAGVYKVGDATVDIQSAKSLLNRYFLSIPLDPYVRGRKENLLTYMPCFESDSLTLPVHLPSSVRIIKLPAKYCDLPRREKHKLLSLMACVRLHCYGLLNERLLPLSKKDMQCHVLQIATQKLQKIEKKPLNLGSFFNGGTRDLYIYPFNEESRLLSDYRHRLNGKGHFLGLVTTAPTRTIPPFSLYHADFGEVRITVGKPTQISCSDREFLFLQQIFLLLINARWGRRSRNLFYKTRNQDEYDAVILPYLVGILSSTGELDWNFMKMIIDESSRSVEERTRATHNISPDKETFQSRIWYATYASKDGVPYVAFGPTEETCDAPIESKIDGVKTHCDYFRHVYSLDFPSNCPLIHCHRMWSLPSGLPKKARSTDNSCRSESVHFDLKKIPQQAFVEATLANAHVASLCIFLPQVLFKFEQQQKTEAFIKHCEVHTPTLGKCFRKMDFSRVALAMTSKSCDHEENCDTLEWVGDAVLKLLQTDSILKSQQLKHLTRFLHEGDLSVLRQAMGTNDRLKKICIHLRLEDFIMMTPLSRGRWVPSPLQVLESQKARSKIPDVDVGKMKLLADVIESMLGVIYLEFGYGTSAKVGNELHVTLPWDETDTSVAWGESGDIDNSVLSDAVTRCTGHAKTFARPKIVSEAFTHPSAIDASVPSYQRLEWIGDAVLCLYTREWLFKNLGQDLTLGELVVLEGAIVSNESLGFVSMKHGLQQYLNHRDQSLPKRIESYCWNVREGCGFWGGDPPKPIADMVEAMLGAIHVASGFESGQAATMNLMSSIFSIFKRASLQGTDKVRKLLLVVKHPKKSLQEMTGQILEVMVCSEHEFALSFDSDDDNENEDNVVKGTTMALSALQILDKNEWRNAMRCNTARSENCCVSFVTILGRPLVAVADKSITVARNRVSSLVREALERHTNLQSRIAKCRSTVESGLTLATHDRKVE